MKIAIVVPGGVDRSGEYRVIPALLALLRRLSQRHDVHVFALMQEPTAGCWLLEGAHIHNIGGEGAGSKIARTVAAILREHRVAPFGVVQAIWSGICGLSAVCGGKLIGVPTMVHYAGGELEALRQIAYGRQLRWRGRAIEALVMRTATAVTAASAPVIERIGARGRTSYLVPLGVDLATWPPRLPQRRAPQESLRLIQVASLNRVKDQTSLLEALALLADWGTRFEMDLIGEDTLGGRIQTLAASLNLGSRVKFRGFLTQRELRPMVERAHVNVVSSLHETGPLVVLEAAIAGVPTAGTAVGHIHEWAPTAALGVPPGDPRALAVAIRRFADDENLRLSIAAEAQKIAVARDADFTSARFEELYIRLRHHGG